MRESSDHGAYGATGATLAALHARALAAVGVGVTIDDAQAPDLPLVWVNPAFTTITGYAPDEALGRNCRFLQGPDTDPAAVDAIRAALRAGRGCTVTLLNYCKDGAPFWVELTFSAVRDGEDADDRNEGAGVTLARMTAATRVRVIAPPTGPTIVGDRARLGRVLENVIGNALKYSPDDAPVEVARRRGDGRGHNHGARPGGGHPGGRGGAPIRAVLPRLDGARGGRDGLGAIREQGDRGAARRDDRRRERRRRGHDRHDHASHKRPHRDRTAVTPTSKRVRSVDARDVTVTSGTWISLYNALDSTTWPGSRAYKTLALFARRVFTASST